MFRNKNFFIYNIFSIIFTIILIILGYIILNILRKVDSSSCALFNNNKNGCLQQSGCTWPYPDGTGSCSDFDNNQNICELTSGCTYPANAGNCGNFYGNESECISNLGCTYPANAGNCSNLSTSICSSVYGCSEITDSCSVGNESEESCLSNLGCAWNNNTCEGEYVSACSGTFDDGACTGSYDDGACTGVYNHNVCVGSYDDIPPNLESAEFVNYTIILKYDENLRLNPLPSKESFSVTENGINVEIDYITVIDNQVIIYLNRSLVRVSSVLISYNLIGILAVSDTSGNNSANFSNYTVLDTNSNNNPTILNKSPNGNQPYNTKSILVEVETDISSICRYDVNPNVEFDSMNNIFEITNSTQHSFLLSDLTPGTEYTYYVRCSDGGAGININDTVINFKIDSMEDNKNTSKKVSSMIKKLNITIYESIMNIFDKIVELYNQYIESFDEEPQNKDKLDDLINKIREQFILLEMTRMNQNELDKFTKDLYLGLKDNEVLLLQQFLNTNGYSVAQQGPGSIGRETDFFGVLTRSALIRFQKENNIFPAEGYLGIKTRAFINHLLLL